MPLMESLLWRQNSSIKDLHHIYCYRQEAGFHVKKSKHDGHRGNASDGGRKTGNLDLIMQSVCSDLYALGGQERCVTLHSGEIIS